MRSTLLIWLTWSLLAAFSASSLVLEVVVVDHVAQQKTQQGLPNQSDDEDGGQPEELPSFEAGIICHTFSSAGFNLFKPAVPPRQTSYAANAQKWLVSLERTNYVMPLRYIENILLFYTAPHAP